MGWPERLDAMERKLEAAERTARFGAPADRTPLPEADGPLPAELVPRARHLLAATRAMEETVRRAHGEVGATLQRLRLPANPAGRQPARRPPAYVDVRA